MRVVAVNLGREFDLRKLEEFFPGKVFARWEEPVVVDVHGSEVYVFAFGTVVFIGYDEEVARSFLEKLREAVEEPSGPFFEEYAWYPDQRGRGRSIRVNGYEVWVRDDAIYGPLDITGKKILAFVLAQSASLRRVEKKVDELMEVVDGIIDELMARPFILSIRRLRISLLEALRTRSSLLNDLLILEKPAATWEEEGYDILFERLRYVFEINERYGVVAKKLSSIVETAEMASELVSDARFFILEFLIVLFFLVELIAFLFE